MISDTLFEAIQEIDRYLTEPAFAGVYVGATRERILALRAQMLAVQVELDLPAPKQQEA